MHEKARVDRCDERDVLRSRLDDLYGQLKPNEHEEKITALLALAVLNLGDSIDAGNMSAR